MSVSFKAISFEKTRVGKLIKSSKKRFSWKFELENSEHEVILFSSRISGKRMILLDGVKTLKTKTTGIGSAYNISILAHKIAIYEMSNTNFEILIDNHVFRLNEKDLSHSNSHKFIGHSENTVESSLKSSENAQNLKKYSKQLSLHRFSSPNKDKPPSNKLDSYKTHQNYPQDGLCLFETVQRSDKLPVDNLPDLLSGDHSNEFSQPNKLSLKNPPEKSLNKSIFDLLIFDESINSSESQNYENPYLENLCSVNIPNYDLLSK